MKAPSAMFRLPSSKALKRFVPLPENHSAVRAVRRLARSLCRTDQSSKAFPILFLHGPHGSGKSHLVHRLLKTVIARKPNTTARKISARDLTRLLEELAPADRDRSREFHDCDLLIVEDAQHLSISGANALAGLIDQRQSWGAPLVITAATGPAMLAHLQRRLTSRLGAGLVIGIEPYSLASRRALARDFCKLQGLYVTDEVIDWLARSPSGGARPILGDIHQLQRLSRIHAPPLDLAMVSAGVAADPSTPPIERLAERVAEHFGLTLKQLKGRDRRRCLLWPRQVGMYLARKLTNYSLPRIGSSFGGYDHSTVLHSCRKVEERLIEDLGLANELAQLSAVLL